PTGQPVVCPSLLPLRANRPTCNPLRTPPTNVEFSTLSVQYKNDGHKTQFKFLLPFLFSSYVLGDGLSDIIVNAAQNATGVVLLGNFYHTNQVLSVSELRLTGRGISFDFTGR